MQSFPVAELNVLNDFGDRLDHMINAMLVNQLRLERVEEGFGHGIVQRIALAAHAAHQSGGFHLVAIVVGRMLNPRCAPGCSNTLDIFYKRQRRHSALGYISPEQFERLSNPTTVSTICG